MENAPTIAPSGPAETEEAASFSLWSRWLDTTGRQWIVVGRSEPGYLDGRMQSTQATLLDVVAEYTRLFPIATLQNQAREGKLKRHVGQVFSINVQPGTTTPQTPETNGT